MAYNHKEVAAKESRLTSGHRMCAGCGAPVVAKMVLKALKPEDHAVIANATRMHGSFYFYLSIYSLERFIYSHSF